ncbi:HNH endonuclease [Streptomyces xiamenensis]
MNGFLELERSARACFRMAVLMGANARTYKFALAEALLDFGGEGREEVPLEEFVEPYAMTLARRETEGAAHAPASTPIGGGDFLAVLRREAGESVRLGHPTDVLREAARLSVPGMVMQKFPNVGGESLPVLFYRLDGRGKKCTVVLTPEMRDVAAAEHIAGLRAENRARLAIVEASFDSGIGQGLMAGEVSVDLGSGVLRDRRRRRSVARVDDAVRGFQHGRCLLCLEPLAEDDAIDIDHVFPFTMMDRCRGVRPWQGPDLDALWNLAPAHRACNAEKTNKPPSVALLGRLARRNEAIVGSPYPLSKAIRGVRDAYGGWPGVYNAVLAAYD